MLTAYGSNEPVLCLTGQVPTDFLGKGRGHLHEMPDQLATLRSFVKWADRIEYPDSAPAMISRAFQEMMSGRRGPVALEMPWDVFTLRAAVTAAKPFEPFPAPQPDPDRIKAAAALIAGSKAPMIFVGGGAMHAPEEILRTGRIDRRAGGCVPQRTRHRLQRARTRPDHGGRLQACGRTPIS